MREKIWFRFMELAQIPQGMLLPWWARTVRAMLFPLDAFYWRISADAMPAITMKLCPECGNKRCPKAADESNECTGSNEPGQPGSNY